MTITMKPDDAMAFRQALEPITLKMVGVKAHPDNAHEIALASIAVSLKRIADTLDVAVLVMETKDK